MTTTPICRWCEEPIRRRFDVRQHSTPGAWVHEANGSRWCDLDDEGSERADPMPGEATR